MVILMGTTANRLKRAMEIRNMKAIDLHDKTGIGKSSISHENQKRFQLIAGRIPLLQAAKRLSSGRNARYFLSKNIVFHN